MFVNYTYQYNSNISSKIYGHIILNNNYFYGIIQGKTYLQT